MNNVSTLSCETRRLRFASEQHLELWNEKTPTIFLSHQLQNSSDSDKILQILCWVYLPQNGINVFHFTWIVRLHHCVKLKVRVFCENFNVGITKLNKFYLFTIIVVRFSEISISDRKIGKHYFNMLAELKIWF